MIRRVTEGFHGLVQITLGGERPIALPVGVVAPKN